MKSKRFSFKKKYFWYFVALLFVLVVFIGVIWFFVGSGEYSLASALEGSRTIPERITDIILGILGAILTTIYGLFAGFFTPLMNAFQDAIFILLGGGWFTKAFKVDYLTFIKVCGGLFLVFGLIFAAVAIVAKNHDGLIFRIIKGFLLFLMMPLVFYGLFSLVGLLSYWVNGSALNDQSIADLINSFSFGLIDDNTDPINTFFLAMVGIITILGVFKFFFEFCIALANRVYEIFLFGTIGIGLASSAIVSDNGKRMSTYNAIMMTKLFNAFLCVLGYLVVINLLPLIVEGIQDGSYETHYSKLDSLKAVLTMVVILASFMILKSLSTEWAFMISGDAKGALATQMNQVGGVSRMVTMPLAKFQRRMSRGASSLVKKSNYQVKKMVNPNESQRLSSLNKSFNRAVGNSKGEVREKNISGWYQANIKKINRVGVDGKNNAEFKDFMDRKQKNVRKLDGDE